MQPGRMVQGSGNGTVKGKKYFTCGDDRGCFVKPGNPTASVHARPVYLCSDSAAPPLAVRAVRSALSVSVTNDRCR